MVLSASGSPNSLRHKVLKFTEPTHCCPSASILEKHLRDEADDQILSGTIYNDQELPF